MAVAEREVEAVGDGDGAVGEAAGYVDRELRLCQAQIAKGVLRPPGSRPTERVQNLVSTRE